MTEEEIQDGYGNTFGPEITVDQSEIKLSFWEGIILLPIMLPLLFIIMTFLFIVIPIALVAGALTGNLKLTVKDNGKKKVEDIRRKRHREGRDIY